MPSAPGRSKAGAADVRRRPRASNLGTEFGEQRFSRVREVTFRRMTPLRAQQILTLRYDDARGLAARGVLPEARPIVQDPAWRQVPKPGRRFAQPPP
jgi:hypothetical protein